MKIQHIFLAATLWAFNLHPARGQITQNNNWPSPGFNPATGTVTDSQWQHGMPLGGIGAGKIELMTDGSFANFTINNNWNYPYGWCQGAFAAICAQAGSGAPVADALRLNSGNEYPGITDVAHAQMLGWFPQATIQFTDTNLPVQVSVTGFAPLIPHDIIDSALPIACLTYTVSNTTSQTVTASMLFAWPNLIGFGGIGASDNKTNWNSQAGNSQSVLTTNGLTGLHYTTTQNYPGSQQQDSVGEYFVGVRASSNLTIFTCTNWDASLDSTPSFWPGFTAFGSLQSVSSATLPSGAVDAQFTLLPGQSQDIHFYVAWYMPHQTSKLQTDLSLVLASTNPTNLASRWTTDCPQEAGWSVTVDMRQMYTPTQLLLEEGNTTDYPRGVQVDISPDETNWTTVASLTETQVLSDLNGGSASEFSFALQPTTGRYLRLTDLGWDPFYYWSITNMQVSVEGLDSALVFEPINLTAPLVDNGHYYGNFFPNAAAVAAYVDQQYNSLFQQTTAWQLPVQNSNLPFWLRLFLINCVNPMVANSVLTSNGMYATQEAPVGQNGNLGTMDQRMSSHIFTAEFFTELDRDELEVFAYEQQPSGSIPHCIGVLDDSVGSPWWAPYTLTAWPDLSCSWVMQISKLCRWTGDTSLTQRMLPHVTAAMNWLYLNHEGTDPVPQGGSTYDYMSLPYNGTGDFSYSASCYLGALEAGSALATAAGDVNDANTYNIRLPIIQSTYSNDLWNGTYVRKFNSPLNDTVVLNGFIAPLAGDWLARETGLPRTLASNFLQQANYQIIMRHEKPFYPIPPMEVTPQGQKVIAETYHLQTVTYLGCESIYQNYVDDGMDILFRTWQAVWQITSDPWNESLGYNAPQGTLEGGFNSYMTSPCTWHILNALSGASVDVPDNTLYVSPRLPSSMTELHIPLYFPRFWAQFDYVPTQSELKLTITQTFTDNPSVESTLFHAPGPYGTGPTNPVVIDYIAADGDAPVITLPQSFTVQSNAVLDLSSYISQLAPGPTLKTPVGLPAPLGGTLPTGKTILLQALGTGMWVQAPSGGSVAANASTVNVSPGSPQLFNVIDQSNGFVALQSAANGLYVTAPNGGSGALTATSTSIGPAETFLLNLDGPGRLGMRSWTNYDWVTYTNSDSDLIANSSAFVTGSPVSPLLSSESTSGKLFLWSDASTASSLTATPGNAQVILTWNPALSANNYNILRSTTSGGPYATIATSSQTSCTDTNAANTTAYFYVVNAVSNGVVEPDSNEASAEPMNDLYAIRCGSSTAIGSFAADNYYSPTGTTFSTSSTIDTSGVVSPAPASVYQHERWANPTLTYTFPPLTPATHYHVRLHFSENYETGPGGRLFNVIINGIQVLTNFDIYLAADSSNLRAVIEDFDTVSDQNGVITIQFVAGPANNPKIDGIEIGVAPPSPPTGLAAIATNGQIVLQWTASVGATNYNIKRATVSGGPYTVLASTNTTNYTDTAVSTAVIYYYVVSAVSGGGQSANSTEASAIVPAPQLSVIHGGGNQVQLSWPGWAAGFQLYAATNLTPPIQWQLVTNSIQSNNGAFWLDLPTNSQLFFELIQP